MNIPVPVYLSLLRKIEAQEAKPYVPGPNNLIVAILGFGIGFAVATALYFYFQ